MASKKQTNPLNRVHAAGIFADMSLDGPEIGTLVLIVDRAKNLPNRKSIGKQDPYCAARLGKEAKKTTTDIRGGQTPRWDQELRFNVHDSPDYYQLKLSLFNDDKKTELIGEAWVDLKDIVTPGGGQNDMWQTLNCKGKYAGEVRIEITYYDSRPKPEKLAAKPKPVGSDTDSINSGRTVKRRPLPSDPVTGQAPEVVPVAEQVQTPPRAQPKAPVAYIPNHSPLQSVEYNTPLPQHSTPPQWGDSRDGSFERTDTYSSYEEDRGYQPDPFSQSYGTHPRMSQNHIPQYDSPPPSAQFSQQDPAYDRPPPPPAHRVRTNSGNSHEMMGRVSMDMSPHKATPLMRHDVLRSEAHRQFVPASSSSSPYPGRPTYRPYDSAPDVQSGNPQRHEEDDYPSQPRHNSYDSRYDPNLRSMQPTVEDVPESWTPPSARRHSSTQQATYDEMGLHTHSPAPLNLPSRNSPAAAPYTPDNTYNQRQYDSNGYSSPVSPVSRRDIPHSNSTGATPNSYQHHHSPAGYGNEMENNQPHGFDDYALPPVPSTLVPGVDPSLAMEVSHRFHEDRRHERRYTQPPPVTTPLRTRQGSEPPSNYGQPPSPYNQQPRQSRTYDRGGIPYSSGPTTPAGNPPGSAPRAIMADHTPSPQHTIARKSVSPAPPPSEHRRLSGVPFGPDAYDALNPSIVSSKEAESTSDYTTTPNGKIITESGREIDPSDHLPMDTWAPEPEPKQPKSASAADTRSRPAPAGAQPMPPSGRRPLRVAPARPQSMAAPPPAPAFGSHDIDPFPPTTTGRNRLQKKAHRASALPAPLSAGSSPLGPATSQQRNSTPPRNTMHANIFDYENHGPPYREGPGGGRPNFSNGPPIPAKVPLMSGGLGPVTGPPGRSDTGNDDWALMQEMSRIDIGNGRARRHGGY